MTHPDDDKCTRGFPQNSTVVAMWGGFFKVSEGVEALAPKLRTMHRREITTLESHLVELTLGTSGFEASISHGL